MNNTAEFCWPPSILSPNGRGHWAVIARAKKKFRSDWAALALSQQIPRMAGGVHISIIFCPPDNRRRDIDNMLASIKSGLDGLADVIGVDDSRWTISMSRGDLVAGGLVVVKISGR